MVKRYQKISFWIINFFILLFILAIIGIIFVASGSNFLTFLQIIFVEPWSTISFFSGFVNVFALIVLLGLAAGLSFKYKIYNFGIPGQMIASAIVTYVTACSLANAGVNSRFAVILLLMIAMIVGSFVGLLVALLKVYFKINEIISTILFNFIIWKGYQGLIASPDYLSLKIPDFASLRFSLDSGPMSPSNLFSAGIIIAGLMLLLTLLLFNSRTFGFKLMAMAENPVAAKQARLNPGMQYFSVLPISGLIAGLAGYLYFLSLGHHLPKLNFLPQEGFYAISIAAIAFFEPSLLIFSAFFMTLFLRPIEMNSFLYLKNPNMIFLILGLTIYLLGIVPFIWKLYENSEWIYDQKVKLKQLWYRLNKQKYQNKLSLLENQKQSRQKVIKINIDANEIRGWRRMFRKKSRIHKQKPVKKLKKGSSNDN